MAQRYAAFQDDEFEYLDPRSSTEMRSFATLRAADLLRCDVKERGGSAASTLRAARPTRR